jgi:protein-L-isoaspartate(D-aspartate) O-methyltransferase
MDYAQARELMVETQLRPNEVTGRRLLAAMREIPREAFLPPAKRPFAYIDESIEVWPGPPPRYLMAPMPLARLIQLASVEAGERVLDVGGATGYSTAVLAHLAGTVVGLECEPDLAKAAAAALEQQAVDNAAIVVGPLENGAPGDSPYDVIVLSGTVPAVPEALGKQLKEGGRLAAIVGTSTLGKAHLFVKVKGTLNGRMFFDAGAKPLPGFAKPPAFQF